MKDNINHPEHYQTKSGLEVIDIIKAATEDLEGMEAVCTGNAIKYLCRWKKKNGLEDLKKAKWYLDRLITELEIKKGCNEVNETFKPNPVPPYTVNNKHKGLCSCGGELTTDGDSKCYDTNWSPSKKLEYKMSKLTKDKYDKFCKWAEDGSNPVPPVDDPVGDVAHDIKDKLTDKFIEKVIHGTGILGDMKIHCHGLSEDEYEDFLKFLHDLDD